VPHTYFETDFLTGTPSDVVVSSGSISLIEDSTRWTFRYEGDVIPTTAGWSESDPLAWTSPTPEILSGVLHLNTIDSDRVGAYSINPSLSNATGWIVEAKMRLGDNSQSDPTGSGCVIDIRDGVRSFMLRFMNTRILDFSSSLDYAMDTRTASNTYRIIGRNDDFYVYVNGTLRLNGNDLWLTTDSTNQLRFNDATTSGDSEAFWDYIYYYNGGTALPYVSLGSFTSGMVDTGTSVNNIGAGATIAWTETLPAGTDISMEFYASDLPSMPGSACASGLTNNLGEVISGTCSGRYIWWKAFLLASSPPNATPTLQDVTINYETCD
jgi:hypothetical protein